MQQTTHRRKSHEIDRHRHWLRPDVLGMVAVLVDSGSMGGHNSLHGVLNSNGGVVGCLGG